MGDLVLLQQIRDGTERSALSTKNASPVQRFAKPNGIVSDYRPWRAWLSAQERSSGTCSEKKAFVLGQASDHLCLRVN